MSLRSVQPWHPVMSPKELVDDSDPTCFWCDWVAQGSFDPLRWFPLQFDKESQKSVNDFIKIVNSIVNNLIQSPILAEIGCKKYPKIGLVLGSLA